MMISLRFAALAAILIPFATTWAQGQEERLVLKSDSADGVWRFYPAKEDLRLRKVLLIGDSIMNGYRAEVARQLDGKATVDAWLTPITLKSPELHQDLVTILNHSNYDIIHFNIGLHEWPKGFIAEGQYEPLLKAFVKTMQDHRTNARLIWASTTQITVQDKPTELDPENNPTIVERNAIAAKVMKSSGIEVNDLYGLMSDKLMLAHGDRFHWTAKGRAAQADAVSSMLIKILDSSLRPDLQNANYDEAKIGELKLPQILVSNSGQAIASREHWLEKRRPEILELYRANVYGRTPKTSSPKFEVLATRSDAVKGLAICKLVRITLPEFPKWDGIEMLLYLPKTALQPCGAFCGLSFGGNHAVTLEKEVPLSTRWMYNSKERRIVNNRATESSRGVEAGSWQIERVLKQGYAVATAYYGDIEPDHADGWKEGVRGIISPQGAETQWKDDDWGAIGAWAWGLSRMMDYLETDPAIDSKRVAVIGHSRLGKTALWAGAQDERFAYVISNNSGEGGAALMRRNFGETTERINRVFPHWFAPKYKTFGNNEAACPVDQHMLIALIAPRPVYIASAAEDEWADPKGEFLSGLYAGPVYQLFGKTGVGVTEQPPINQPVGVTIGYHIRTGRHTVTDYDWDQFLRFFNEQK